MIQKLTLNDNDDQTLKETKQSSMLAYHFVVSFKAFLQDSFLLILNRIFPPFWTLLFTTEQFLATAASSSEICMRTLSMRGKWEKMNNEYTLTGVNWGWLIVMIGLFKEGSWNEAMCPLTWQVWFIFQFEKKVLNPQQLLLYCTPGIMNPRGHIIVPFCAQLVLVVENCFYVT